MPDTFTPGGLLLIGSGERSGTWGTVTNTNMQILGRMISQAGTIALSGTTHTLTVSDGVLSDGHYAVLVFGGTPSGTNTVTINPNDAKRTFFVKNDSGQSVVLTQGSGGDVTVADGKTAIVYCDGAGSGAAVVDIAADLAVTPITLADLGVTASAAELNTLDGITATTAELNTLDGITATTAELNILDGVTWTLTDYNTLTATAAELNLLDGVTWTLTDYNTLTATAAELNLLDGITAVTGADTEIVTGTAGTDGQVAQWNADGDVVGYTIPTQDTATWEAGTDTTESLVSPAKVKAAIEAETVGWGQTWQDVSASRSLGTSYQNTTGKPIFVVISATKNYSVSVSNDGTSWIELSNAGVEFSESGTSFVAPPQTYYKIESTGSATAIRSWVELR